MIWNSGAKLFWNSELGIFNLWPARHQSTTVSHMLVKRCSFCTVCLIIDLAAIKVNKLTSKPKVLFQTLWWQKIFPEKMLKIPILKTVLTFLVKKIISNDSVNKFKISLLYLQKEFPGRHGTEGIMNILTELLSAVERVRITPAWPVSSDKKVMTHRRCHDAYLQEKASPIIEKNCPNIVRSLGQDPRPFRSLKQTI